MADTAYGDGAVAGDEAETVVPVTFRITARGDIVLWTVGTSWWRKALRTLAFRMGHVRIFRRWAERLTGLQCLRTAADVCPGQLVRLVPVRRLRHRAHENRGTFGG